MAWVKKIAIGLAVVAAIAAGYWYLIQSNQQKAETIGRLEAQQEKLKQGVEDSEANAERLRTQMEMWQWLYDDLQSGYQDIREQRKRSDAELAALKERQDVQDYLECPMPDSLYDWVRKN